VSLLHYILKSVVTAKKMSRMIGTHENHTYDAPEQEQKELEAELRDKVLATLQTLHPGTVVSHEGHPTVNPVHRVRFMRNPLGPRDDENTVLQFTCQVVNDKLVATIPLAHPFVRRLHENPEDLAEYTRCLNDAPLAATVEYQEEIEYEKPDGENIGICLTYEIGGSWTDVTERSCLLMADNAEEFAELLDVVLGTNILPSVKRGHIQMPPDTSQRKRKAATMMDPRKRKADEIRASPSDQPGVLAKRGKPALAALDLNAPSDRKYYAGIPFGPVPATTSGWSLDFTTPRKLAKIAQTLGTAPGAPRL
jgi:hypothetical protein